MADKSGHLINMFIMSMSWGHDSHIMSKLLNCKVILSFNNGSFFFLLII